VEAIAGALFQQLQQFYPLRSPKELSQVALFVAKEQIKLRPVTEAYIKKDHTHIEFSLIEPRNVIMPGAKVNGLKMQAPLRFEDCKDLDQMMKCVTIFAITASPLVQACSLCTLPDDARRRLEATRGSKKKE
jgi:hypothetical protein